MQSEKDLKINFELDNENQLFRCHHALTPSIRRPFFGNIVNWHSQFEFVMITKGSGYIFVNNVTERVRVGSIYAISPYELHRMYTDEEGLLEFYYLIPSNKMLELLRLDIGSKKMKRDITDTLTVEYFTKFGEEYDKKEDASYAKLFAYASLFLQYAAENFVVSENEYNEDNFSQNCFDVIRYVSEHLAEDLSSGTIAAELGYNRVYLARKFKKFTGQTISDYVNFIRCSTAHDYLRSTNISVAEAAERVGYSSVSYFIKMYKKHYGKIPSSDKKEK